MKSKLFLGAAISILFLAVFACGPFAAPTPTAIPPTEQPPTAISTLTPTPTSSPPTATATAPEPTTPAPTLPPTPEPQPAANPHYHAGDPVQLDEIHMLSSTDGWGVSGAYVLVTADGGQTWRQATPPETLPAGAQVKVYGAFLDKLTAWVIFSADDQIVPEASVWHTTDGGRTWTPSAPLLHQVNAQSVWAEFAMLDAENVWMMVRGVYLGAGTHHTHELFRTTDGGLTWTSLDGEISDDYTGMVFADTGTGWRTLQTTGAYAPAPPAYDVTTDGGANWDNRELPPPPEAPDLFNNNPYCETYQPTLFSTQSVRLLVGCFDYYDPPKVFSSYLYASEDGGTTWKTVHLPDPVLAPQDRLIFFGADTALLLGRDMYRTADGGLTWSHVKTVNWDGQFSFVDPQNGWAVARANNEIALEKTTNGGGTWSTIKPTITG